MARTHTAAPPTVATKAPSPTPLPDAMAAGREHAGVIFAEIAHTANAIKRLTSMLTGDGVINLEDEPFVLVALESLAERAGMLADLGAHTFGEMAMVGGVAEWTMPYWPIDPHKG